MKESTKDLGMVEWSVICNLIGKKENKRIEIEIGLNLKFCISFIQQPIIIYGLFNIGNNYMQRNKKNNLQLTTNFYYGRHLLTEYGNHK